VQPSQRQAARSLKPAAQSVKLPLQQHLQLEKHLEIPEQQRLKSLLLQAHYCLNEQ
jgi:hypothetical protein